MQQVIPSASKLAASLAADPQRVSFLNNPTRGDKMERDKRISKIEEMFFENIPTVDKIIKRKEHESVTFCLVIGDKLIGVDIQKSFIDSKTIEGIKDHFSERHIYHSILNDKMCDHEGIFVHTNDPSCRDMM